MENNKTMTLGSLFSGSGGFELGGMLAGITPVWNSEVSPFPVLVTHKRLPKVKHYGDVSELKGSELEPVDIITSGSPCQNLSIAGRRAGILDGARSNLFFQAIRIIKEMREATNGQYPRYFVWENVCFPAGTLVTTEHGYRPIENIRIGDKVKTLSGKYMPVRRAYKTKEKEVIQIKASGSEPIVCTPDHPFLTKKRFTHSGSVVYRHSFSDPIWVKASELTTEDLVGYVLDVPDDRSDWQITETEAWAIGRWLADGSVDLSKSNPRIFISCGLKKLQSTKEHLDKLPYDIHMNKPHPTAVNFTFTSWDFYKLIESAGKGAANKCVPPYVFQLPLHLQREVLAGYISGDGYTRDRGGNTEFSASTVSRELAYGIARLIRNCWHEGCSMKVDPPKDATIDGRILQGNHPVYILGSSLNTKKSLSFVENGILWQPIRAIERCEKKETVYNLSVEEDNTYEVNNIIVHNCGAFTSNGGDDFQAVLEAVVGIKEEGIEVPAPANHRWGKADVLLGDGWSVAWRVLDSQHFGVPQRRSRIFLVGDLAGERAGEVLFNSEGMSGYSPESFRAWQRAAGGAEDGTGTTGCRSDAEGRDAGSGGSRGGYGRYCLNPQGNSGVGITEEKTLALVAQDHGNHPAVLHSAGFCTEHSAQSRSIGYEEEKSPTLRAGVIPAALMFDNHAQDARYNGPKENSPTVTARYGTGGNNQPLVAEPRAYGVCSKASNAMLSDNPHSGFYEAKTSRTLDRGGGNPCANQGGICVVEPVEKPKAYALQGSMIGRDDKNGPNGSGVNEEVSFTLTGMDHHAVAAPVIPETEEIYCATTGSYMTVEKEKSHTLMARDYKDPQIINDNEIEYAVRRLTPTECARLQGFPDWWCSDLAIPDPTDEELSYWLDVWNTWQKITGKKPKNEKQVRKWLADPYKDSDEYTLWGNGVSLPVVYFVLSGIVWADSKEG